MFTPQERKYIVYMFEYCMYVPLQFSNVTDKGIIIIKTSVPQHFSCANIMVTIVEIQANASVSNLL